MNDASLSDEISVQHLTLEVRQQTASINLLRNAIAHLNDHVGEIEQRLVRLENPQTVRIAYTSPVGWEVKQRAVESKRPGKWRDAKSDPPMASGVYAVFGRVAGRELVWFEEFVGEAPNPWCASEISNVTHWQPLPPPPQATESK